MGSMFSAISVIALYVETILQIYVTVATENDSINNSPAAILSLCTICVTFLSTSIASFFMAEHSTHDTPTYDTQTHDTISHSTPPHNTPTVDTATNFFNNDNLKSKYIFRCLHIFQCGLFWRIFKLVYSSTGSDIRCLTSLRLVHVAIQSLPYTIIYSTTFLVRGKINAIQTLSLISSLISSSIAVSCYNMRQRLCMDEEKEGEAGTLKHAGSFKSMCVVLTNFIGTTLVIFARSASITLMAAQVRLWVLIPLFIHFLIILVVLGVFSSRNKSDPCISMFLKLSLYCFGMAVLNTFDLVYDKIAHIMCKYVAFYSLLLVENIVFISFWLLNFDLDYVSKLVTVVGILSGFIVGLIIKFTSCTLFQTDVSKYQSQNDEDISQTVTTLALPSISTTAASAGLNLNLRLTPMNKEDDLVSIVQASLAHRAHHRNERIVQLQHSPSNQIVQLGVRSAAISSKISRKKRHSKKVNKNYQHKRRRSNGLGRDKTIAKIEDRHKHEFASNCLHHSVQIQTHTLHNNSNSNNESTHKSTSSRSDKLLSYSKRPVLSDTTDQNDSFQQSSVFSVSEPDTLLSDMMYTDLGGEVFNSHRDSFNQLNEHNKQHKLSISSITPHEHKILPKLFNSHETSQAERIIALNHPPFHMEHENLTAKKGRIADGMNTRPFSQTRFVDYGKSMASKGPPFVGRNRPRDEFTQPNESSDTALSSAKTYPCESKSGGLKEKTSHLPASKFDKEMKNILSSIEGGQNRSIYCEDTSVLPHRFSDSETLARRNVKVSKSNERKGIICKNIITYTEADDNDVNILNISRGNQNRSQKSDKNNTLSSRKSKGKASIAPKDNAPAPSVRTVAPPINALRLCDSGSSSFTSTGVNDVMSQTRSSTSTTMTTEDCWKNDQNHSSDGKSDRLSQFIMQSDVSRISPSENILRWLSTTSHNSESST